MSGGSSIVDFRADSVHALDRSIPVESDPIIEDPPEYSSDYLDEEEAAPPPIRWALPAVAIIACLLWFGGMAWLARDSLKILPPVALTEFIAALCVVPALAGVVWLLFQRTSRAEARRFGETARAMRAEAASLERTVAGLANSIEANRAALAEQIATLMAMGDGANERLAAVGRGMAEEIGQADSHARTLAQSVVGARADLSILLTLLPNARAEVDTAAALLGQTGLAASEHAAALDAQIVALSDRGREAHVLAGGAAQRLAAHIARMEATGETAGTRLEAVTGQMSEAVDALLGRTAEAVEGARASITAQGDAMLAMVGANQAALDSAARDSAEALAERIASVEQIIERVAGRLAEQRTSGDAIVGELDTGIGRVEGRLNALHTQGVERSQLLAASISALGGSADAMTVALKAGDDMATRTIGTAENLLIALDAVAREIDETLPDALNRLETKINESRRVVGAAKPELLSLVTAAESTHDAIEAIAGVIAEQRSTVDRLSGTLLDTLQSGRSKADALGEMVEETINRTNRFAEESAPRLVDALLRVRETASAAADRARETLATVIPEAAIALEAASADAMRRATTETVERQVRAIADVTEAAVDAATRAADRLSRQVQAIADQTAIVETRFEDARAEREEADHDTFSRRVSLLIESLNSASIDITKSLAPEVTDSAWAAYLKGDRGVFTRRAVRILDAGEARDIARYYDDDSSFREMVNRYIHDFEAMLRAVLAQRDGTPMGVTLLSADMGKLYVALAQAIERLR